jgi:hypothetical protein
VNLFWITISGPDGTIDNGGIYPPAGPPIVGKGIKIHQS